jgi:hypothetical protein
MTLTPDRIGDKGQRYEITYVDVDTGQRRVFGWASTIEGARQYETSISLHPSMASPLIRDRAMSEPAG